MMSRLEVCRGAFRHGLADVRRAVAEIESRRQIVSSASRNEVIEVDEAKPLAIVHGRAIHGCDVPGCTNLVMDGARCNTCREEWAALECNAVERALRQQDRAERRERVWNGLLQFWLSLLEWERDHGWVLALILFVVCVSWVAYTWGATLLGCPSVWGR